MATNITLTRPHAGQSITEPVGPDARLEFAFDQNEGVLAKEGQNLVLTFNDGGKLVLEGFYDNFGDNAQPPTLVVQGHELDGQAFLAAYDKPDLMPAAGDVSVSTMGGGEYADAQLHGVGGVSALDKLPFDGHGVANETRPVYESPSYQTTQEQHQSAAPPVESPVAAPAGPPPVIHGAYQIGTAGNDNIIGEAGKQNILIGDSDTPLNVPPMNLVIAVDVSQAMSGGAGGQLDAVKHALESYVQQLANYPNDFSVEILLINPGSGTSQWMDLGSRLVRSETDGIDSYSINFPRVTGDILGPGNLGANGLTRGGAGNADFAGAFTKADSWFNSYGNPAKAGTETSGGTSHYTHVATDVSDYVNKMVIISAGSPGNVNQGQFNSSGSAYSHVTVDAIAVGNNAAALGNLTSSDGAVANLGGTDLSTLQAAILQSMEQFTPTDLYQAGSDVLAGSDQNDVMFGDALNTAALSQLAHDQLTTENYNNLSGDFSAAAVFAALEHQGWTQDDIASYVQTHADALAVENPGAVSGGNDLLVGGHGNDQIFGQSGDDVLIAGDIHLSAASPVGEHDYAASDVSQFLTDLAQTPDTLAQYLAAHPDYVGQGTAADGNNYLSGGSGNDVLIGGGGTDTLDGGAGNDLIFTGGGNNNLVHGGAGNDTIYVGGGDHNTVYGDAGNDVIYAGSGHNNVIYGGAGNDVMHADAAGSATFAWNPTTDFDGGTDQVLGFKVGSDHLSFGELFDTSQPVSESAIQTLLEGRSDGQQMTVAADTANNTITLTIHEGATVQQTVEVSFAPADHAFVADVATAATNGDEAAQAQHLLTLITNVGG